MLAYYANKLRNTLLTRYATPLGGRWTAPGLLCGAIGDFEFQRRFVFYFADTQYVHLGDQLFHQPLLALWQRHGYDVRVAAAPAFASYFTSQGLPLLQPDEYGEMEGAIIITKNDLARDVSRLFPRGNYFVGVNYHLVEYTGPITVGLARAVYSALDAVGLNLPPLPEGGDELYLPYVPPPGSANGSGSWREAIASDQSEQGGEQAYLVYNDYVSSAYLEARRREPIIRDQGKRWRAQGYRLIYTGTQRERLACPHTPDFIDLDLRGDLGTLDLYELFARADVHGVVCFDTFVMHVASALRKDLYVTMKKRGRNWESYRQRYIPMYPGADKIVQECL